MRFRDKVALVTGAASGIGAACARGFARGGAHLILADKQDDLGQVLAAEINGSGVQAIYVHADVSRSADVKRLADEADTRFGRVDILFNCAGIWRPGTVQTMLEEEWDAVIDTNLKSVFLVSKFVIPLMVAAGGGSIINVASVAGMVGARDAVAYTASKGGVINLTRSMALDLAPHGIRVNVLCPGMIDTQMGDNVVRYYKPGADLKASKANWQPLEHIGCPEDMVGIVNYLASDEASFATGGVFVVDGGLTSE